jgi:hypothetical protein
LASGEFGERGVVRGHSTKIRQDFRVLSGESEK